MNPNDQTCNAAGRKLIEDFESFCPNPYRDTGGIWTIGYGHTHGVSAATPPCTPQQADGWLEDDLGIAEQAINDLVRYEISGNQFSALVSFVFNIGYGNFERSSALHWLNAGEFEQVPAAMLLWSKDHHGTQLPGLVRRRNAEIALFETPDPEGEADDNSSA